jgi:multimeric flavodoxin WrbA
MNILAIVGSPRQEGNTNYLVDIALEEAKKLGIETEKIVLSKYNISPCQGHVNCASYESCTQKDDAAWILDKFQKANGIILATPVYWFNMTAQMKTFIDRNYFSHRHAAKYKAQVVGFLVVATSEGIKDTLHTLNRFVDWRFHIDKDNKLIAKGYANKPGDATRNKSLVDAARKLGRQIAEKLQ